MRRKVFVLLWPMTRRFLARSAAKYTKTEKINVVDLFVDIARKIIKIRR